MEKVFIATWAQKTWFQIFFFAKNCLNKVPCLSVTHPFAKGESEHLGTQMTGPNVQTSGHMQNQKGHFIQTVFAKISRKKKFETMFFEPGWL